MDKIADRQPGFWVFVGMEVFLTCYFSLLKFLSLFLRWSISSNCSGDGNFLKSSNSSSSSVDKFMIASGG